MNPLEATKPSDQPASVADEINAARREQRNGHAGMILWLTGLSGAGKTTIATALERELFQRGKHTYLLDGDVLRLGLCSDLDFSPASREENIRRAGAVAALMADAGLIVIAAFISPSRAARRQVRARVAPGRFVEIFVNAPLEVCERRDVKGLYAKARANKIQQFTGISAPYEAPENPEIELHTDQFTPAHAVARVIDFLSSQGWK